MAMTFNYFLLNLKMALMHTFTQKFIDELDATKNGTYLEETYDEFVMRHLYAFVQLRSVTEQQAKDIERAILDAKEEAKLHVAIVGEVVQDGMGRQINQIEVISQFWEDHFVS